MTSDLAKIVGAGFRDKDKLITGVTRHLMRQEESDRRADCIHPSEMASEHWCPRATYYRIAGAEADVVPRKLAMEMVFERGHDAHGKWQSWFRDMGILRGTWICLYCGLHFEGVSPYVCPRCEVGADLIRYAEVPVENKEFMIAGSADGDVLRDDDSTLIEIKTIGEGTLRYDAPALIEKYSYQHTDDQGKTHTGTDWYSLWTGIRRPFAAHLRQGMIYCFCLGRKGIVYIYEPKFVTAYPKEFEIKFRRDLIEDRLEQCTEIRNALDKGHPPKRPMWAEQQCTTCRGCPFRSTCYGNRGSDSSDRRAAGTPKSGVGKRRA